MDLIKNILKPDDIPYISLIITVIISIITGYIAFLGLRFMAKPKINISMEIDNKHTIYIQPKSK
jgi:hypothetical protein